MIGIQQLRFSALQPRVAQTHRYTHPYDRRYKSSCARCHFECPGRIGSHVLGGEDISFDSRVAIGLRAFLVGPRACRGHCRVCGLEVFNAPAT